MDWHRSDNFSTVLAKDIPYIQCLDDILSTWYYQSVR